MTTLLELPGIVKILVTLLMILVLNRYTKSLVLAVLAGALVFAFWSGQSVAGAATIVWERLSALNTMVLSAIIVLVLWLSGQMRETGIMEELVGSVRSRLSQRASMAVLPAVVGLLPVPGGALFSAPMVEDLDRDGTVPDHLKTRTNYWFRHVWEYWWPLYPGVLLAIDLSGLQVWQYVLLQLPLSAVAIWAGYLFLLRRIPAGATPPHRDGKQGGFLSSIIPIALVITVYALIRLLLPGVASVSKYLPMFFGIVVAIVYLQIRRPLSFTRWKGLLFSPSSIKMLAIVFSILVYGAFIEARLPGGILFMDQVRGELTGAGIPLVLIIVLLPFISGLATGLALGFVGASFPIVMNLLGASPSIGTLLSHTLLAFGCGYMGMMLSPVHVCLVVTTEYFKTGVLHSLKNLLAPAALVMGATVILHLLVGLFVA